MYLINVYPIIKGNWTSELQYWSEENIEPGSIIKVPLKGKSISGLVFSSIPLKEAKSIIKDADFKTRKIEKANPLNIVRKEFIKAVENTTTYHVQNFGAMLKAAIPSCAFSYSQKNIKNGISNNKSNRPIDILAVSVNSEDRLGTYKSMIREELARKKSVLLIAPTARTAEILFNSIKKGIEHVVILIHGNMQKKKIEEAWKKAIELQKSAVIIVTPAYMSITRQDIETIIVEGESSRAYKTFFPPYFDWRKLAENYAKESHIKLIYGDQMLSLDTLHRIHNYEINEIFPISYHLRQEAEIIVVDMKDSKLENGENGAKESSAKEGSTKFELLSEELASMIEYAKKKKQNMFIFVARRGLSPQTICADCGKTVECKTCHAPVVLHKSSKGERYFLCHHCGRERQALEACINCQSWNLTTLGIGTDTIYEKIKKEYPGLPLFKIDKDSAKNDKEAKKIAADFAKQHGAVLIGTETALSYIEKVKLVAIASIDSLFSIPDFRINERIAHIILRLGEIAESYFLIQTRKSDSSIIKAINTKTLAEFVKEEMDIRKKLNYPPYSIMGKISLTGTVDVIGRNAKKIETILKDYDPTIFPAMVPAPEGKGSTINIIFNLPTNIWNKENRISNELWIKLSTISHIAPIQINPESFI